MKKIAIIILAISMVSFVSCKNQNKKVAQESDQQEEVISEEVFAELKDLQETIKRLSPAPFATASKDGKIVLTKKEQSVKPTFLLDPKVASDFVTFDQYYKGGAILAVDCVVADMYEMDSADYKNAIAEILTKTGDESFTQFACTPWSELEGAEYAFLDLAKAEYEAGRAVYFWETVAACFTEQIYVITRDVDKFLPMFTDETVGEFTFNFICLYEGLKSEVESHPEMAELKTLLEPLYGINAISVAEFKTQLESLKTQIEAIRAELLK